MALYRFEFSGELIDDVEIRSFYEDDMTIPELTDSMIRPSA